MRQSTRATSERLARIYALLLRNEHCNTRRLARELEVSRKTIERDLEFLRERMRLPVSYNASRFSYELTREHKLPWWLQRPGDRGFVACRPVTLPSVRAFKGRAAHPMRSVIKNSTELGVVRREHRRIRNVERSREDRKVLRSLRNVSLKDVI